ncbi:MAG: hypothetical protein H6822_17445 [Planctomycetaceae bacterium]|nr:hypothetical protein [Planctomycetales bacterium]MCB9923971.1 hypothetical protein [Planctomycetaceae bacterium]
MFFRLAFKFGLPPVYLWAWRPASQHECKLELAGELYTESALKRVLSANVVAAAPPRTGISRGELRFERGRH